jgi:TolB-like protein
LTELLKPSKADILDQLSRILRSQVFRDSEMLRNFLAFIVQEATNDNTAGLKQYNIAINAFGRNPDFDATIDPIVRIQASRLRRNLELYYREEGQEDKVHILLPKGSYIPVFSFAEHEHKPGEGHTSESNSIAVYPFKNLGGDNDRQYIVDGFSQELLMELSRYKDIRVIRVKDEVIDCTKLSLSRFSLEGSIRFGKESNKISIEVSDNHNNQVIWSDQKKFDFRDCEPIQVQEVIARSVAQKIADINGIICEKLQSESNWEHTHDLTAYDAFLHFHEYNKNPTERNANEILEKVNTAVQRDPAFGPGFAVLANIYTDIYIFGLDREHLKLALEYGKKAVELQANNQVCQLYYAFPLMVADRLVEAEKHLKYGHQLNRNATYFTGSIGWLYSLMDQFDPGFKLIRDCMKTDFQYPKWLHLGTFLYYLDKGDYNRMLVEANMFDTPGLFWSPLLKLISYQKLSQPEQAMQQLRDLTDNKPDFIGHAKEYIRCLVKSDDLSKQMIEAVHAVLKFSE